MTPYLQNTFIWQGLISVAAPPRDPYDNDEDEDDEADEDREPPVIREADEDE
jgi:hypothetical protein